MVNYNILLWKNSQSVQDDEYFENLSIPVREEISSDREILNKNPFVKFIDLPISLQMLYNPETNEIESRTVSVSTWAGNIIDSVNNKDNKNKMFYILPFNKNEISQKGPTMYNPNNFMPVEGKSITRFGLVNLTNRQVEEIIFEHEYINDENLNDEVKDELFYFKDLIENDPFSVLPTITKRLMSTKHRLSEKAYKIYGTLVDRLRIPDEETFNRWLNRLEKIDSRNNDYIYILTRK